MDDDTPPPASDPDAPALLRTVRVGGRTKAALREAFREHRIAMNALGERLFRDERFLISPDRYDLATVEVCVRHLGLPQGGTTAQVYERARGLGLAVAPLELGPFLRLHILDQADGPRITLSAPRLSGDTPNGFYLQRRQNHLWLRGYTASADYAWDPGERFVFRAA